MSDVDLIPADYRFGLWVRRSGRRLLLALGLLLIAAAIAYGALKHINARIRSEVEALQQQQVVTADQRKRINELVDRKQWAEGQLRLLKGLRGGVEARSMFTSVDRALTDDSVWFTRWEFQRAGSIVEHKQDAVRTGYFVVLPKQDSASVPEAWKLESHMTIQGGARDYAALSGFVSRLLVQPEIQSVHVSNTVMRDNAEQQFVEFTLAVVVDTTSENI